jgi:Zn-dependent protease
LALPPLDLLLASFIVLILSLSVHEAAHAWSADRLGDPTARMYGRLTVNPVAHVDPIGTILFPLIGMLSPGVPLLGWAKPVPVNMRNLRHPRRDFALVAFAGPLSNIVMAVIAAVILSVLPDEMAFGPMTPRGLLARFVVLNVFLAVFNMIPVPPLDGGNVLSGFVPEPVARLIDQIRPWGFLVLYALLFTGVLDTFVTPVASWILERLPL